MTHTDSEPADIPTQAGSAAVDGGPFRWARPVSRTLGERVTDMILQRIAAGDLPPGTALPPQRELAREVGVAMSVVREAIQRLQMLRVVQTRHGSGTVVQPVTWSQIAVEPALRILAFEPRVLNDIRDARYAIEKETTRLAAERATDDDLRDILKALDAGDPVPLSFADNVRLNREFHLAIARAAKNSILFELLVPFLEVGFTSTPEVWDYVGAEFAWDAHKRLFHAISQHDATATQAALDYHMSSANVEVEKVRSLLAGRTGAKRNGRA
jgi:DNA-binding FadR family transcriptional regulator